MTKDHGGFYQEARLRVLGMATMRMVYKSLVNQHFDIHWYYMVDLIYYFQMRRSKEMKMEMLRLGHF